jgi:hypothetical protein
MEFAFCMDLASQFEFFRICGLGNPVVDLEPTIHRSSTKESNRKWKKNYGVVRL